MTWFLNDSSEDINMRSLSVALHGLRWRRSSGVVMMAASGDGVQRASQVFGGVPSDLAFNDKVPRAPLTFENTEPLMGPENVFGLTAALLGVVLYLGPDVWLASIGLESGVRPGRSTELFYGELLNATDFVDDAREGFLASPPWTVRALTSLTYFGLGGIFKSLTELAFDDASFVFALAVCALIAESVYEVGRPNTPTRSEAEATSSLETAFEDFASDRLERAGPQYSVHKTEIVAAFRRSVAKYRSADASGVPDTAIEKIARRWIYANPRPGALVTPAGFFKGLKINKEPDVF